MLWREGTGPAAKQKSKTFDTQKQAKDFHSLVEILGAKRALAELKGRQAATITVDQLAAKFLEWKATTGITPRTLTDYRRDYANHISPALGSRRAESIDELDVQEFVDSLAATLSPKTVADRHMLLHSMFKFGSARTRRLVGHNPCTETQLPKRGKRIVRGATLPEWLALRDAGRRVEPDAADLMEFIAATGWRWSEAAALPVRHVTEWEQGGRIIMRAEVGQVFRRDGTYKLTIAEDEAKSQAGLRTTKVPRRAADIVRRRIAGKKPDDLVFTNSDGRQWYQQNFLSRTWPRIEEAAGLERHLTPHAMRHLHVALLDRSGATPSQMQRRVGHEDIRTTLNVYGGMIDDIDDDVLDSLDALLNPETDTVVGEVVQGAVIPELD